MKDITKEILDSILNDEETIKKRSEILLYGEKIQIPYDVFLELLPKKIYEIEDIQEIHDNYKKLSEKRRLPLKVLNWLGKDVFIPVAKQGLDSPNFVHENQDLEDKYGDEYKELFGEDRSKFDRIQMKFITNCQLYLTNITIRNKENITRPLFSAVRMDLVDKNNIEIKAFNLTEHQLNHVITPIDEEAEGISKKKKLDQMSLEANERPFILCCYAQKRKNNEHQLQIQRIQDGGKKIEPVLPTIGM